MVLHIGLVSDTHLMSRTERLPRELVNGLRGVDLILHAGDWVSLTAVSLLEQIAPVNGVAGNNDGLDLLDRFGLRKIIEVDGIKIGIVHGHIGGKTAEACARYSFLDEDVDMVLFGHSHVPFASNESGRLLFNPGSPTQKRRQPQYSYGILRIENGKLRAEHLFFDSQES